MSLPTRKLGELSVSAVGLGCMPMSFPENLNARARSIATLHRAIDLGITLLDTANVYAPDWKSVGHNEALVAEAVRTYAGPADLTQLIVTTKGGITIGEAAEGRDSSTAGLLAACRESVAQLGVEVIELYQHHRHDPDLTYADQVRALLALRDAGLIRRIGLSNVRLPELEVALELIGGPAEGGVVSVQNEFSPRFRRHSEVLDCCTELGIAFLPWSPLGGSVEAHEIGSRYRAFADVGEEIGATPQETVLAWLLRLSPVIIPIPGATRPETVESIVRAPSLLLDDDQFARLQATEPDSVSVFADDRPRSPLR